MQDVELRALVAAVIISRTPEPLDPKNPATDKALNRALEVARALIAKAAN